MKHKHNPLKSALIKNLQEVENTLSRINNKCADKVEEKCREKKFFKHLDKCEKDSSGT